jgi:hypothetical protein
MRRGIALGIVCAALGTAVADTPKVVAPFLSGDEESLHVATGAFAGKDSMVVVWWDLMGRGTYPAFGLVPDAKAKGGYRKVKVAKLPEGVIDGKIATALAANLDKDPADELVLELRVNRTGPGGMHTYGTVEYAVLDWNGTSFVRLGALEAKLATKMKSRKDAEADPLTEVELRAALGVK